jgi:hypothetical protein
VRGDDPCRPGWSLVQLVIHGQTEPVQALDHGSPQGGVVLAHPGGEGEHIQPAENGQVRADVVLEPVHVHLESELGRFITGRPPLLQLPEVVDPGHTLQARLFVQQGVDVTHGQAELVVQEGVQPRIHVAGASSHHQALQRRQAHRRLHRDPAAYG